MNNKTNEVSHIFNIRNVLYSLNVLNVFTENWSATFCSLVSKHEYREGQRIGLVNLAIFMAMKRCEKMQHTNIHVLGEFQTRNLAQQNKRTFLVRIL
jgi:hypothetical protein